MQARIAVFDQRKIALLLLPPPRPSHNPSSSDSSKPHHPPAKQRRRDTYITPHELVPAFERGEEAAVGFGRDEVEVVEGEEDVLRRMRRAERKESVTKRRGRERMKGEERAGAGAGKRRREEKQKHRKRTVQSAKAKHPKYAPTTFSNPSSPFPPIFLNSLRTVGSNTIPNSAKRKKQLPS